MSAYCNLTGLKLGKRLSPTLINGVLKKKQSEIVDAAIVTQYSINEVETTFK